MSTNASQNKVFIDEVIKHITCFSFIYIKKNQNQDTKCVMTIMIRDGLKMDAGGCRWLQMNENGSIGVGAFGGTRK